MVRLLREPNYFNMQSRVSAPTHSLRTLNRDAAVGALVASSASEVCASGQTFSGAADLFAAV